MAFENADPRERAFYAAIPLMGLPVGLALASFLLAVPSYFLPESAFLNYGWRVSFMVSAVFTLSYATQQLGVSQSVMYGINIIFAFVSMPFVLKAGKLADRWGKGRLFCLSSIACGIVAVPGLLLIQYSGGNPLIITLVIIVGWSICYAGIWGVLGSLWAQLFETEVRYSGISFVYHAPSFLVAGIVPSLCTYFLKISNGSVMVIGIFVVFVSIVSTACGYIMQKRHDNNMAQADMG